MSKHNSQKEVFVGNLPQFVTKKMVKDIFKSFGSITKIDIRLPRGLSASAPYAFLEFEDPRDAEDAIKAVDGSLIDKNRIRVEHLRVSRWDGRVGCFRNRVVFKGLPESTTWQYLKDYVGGAVGDGAVMFANIFPDGTGVVDFYEEENVDRAISKMNNTQFRGLGGKISTVHVTREKMNMDERPTRVPHRSSGYYCREGRAHCRRRDGFEGRPSSGREYITKIENQQKRPCPDRFTSTEGQNCLSTFRRRFHIRSPAGHARSRSPCFRYSESRPHLYPSRSSLFRRSESGSGSRRKWSRAQP